MRTFSLAAALLWLVSPLTAGAEPIAERLQGSLVRAEEGRLVPAPAPRRARYVAVYFGAGWCAPCRAFVPELKRRYPSLRRAGVEIVFLSDDAGCRAMLDYVLRSRMPWPVVACRDRRRLGWLAAARGKALPGLIVYDAAGGQRINSWSVGGQSSPKRALDALEALALQR